MSLKNDIEQRLRPFDVQLDANYAFSVPSDKCPVQMLELNYALRDLPGVHVVRADSERRAQIAFTIEALRAMMYQAQITARTPRKEELR